ncbi:MAG: hypothetical protein AAFP02_23610, partial [Bacteroidota bacterium]
ISIAGSIQIKVGVVNIWPSDNPNIPLIVASSIKDSGRQAKSSSNCTSYQEGIQDCHVVRRLKVTVDDLVHGKALNVLKVSTLFQGGLKFR